MYIYVLKKTKKVIKIMLNKLKNILIIIEILLSVTSFFPVYSESLLAPKSNISENFNLDEYGTTEFKVLIAMQSLQIKEKYLIPITVKVNKLFKDNYPNGTIHRALERLEKRNFVIFSMSDIENKQGGRRKKLYSITEYGMEKIIQFQTMLRQWDKIIDLSM